MVLTQHGATWLILLAGVLGIIFLGVLGYLFRRSDIEQQGSIDIPAEPRMIAHEAGEAEAVARSTESTRSQSDREPVMSGDRSGS
jgi:hypothetical protein